MQDAASQAAIHVLNELHVLKLRLLCWRARKRGIFRHAAGEHATNVAPQLLTTLPKSSAPVVEGGSLSGASIIVNAYAGGIKEVKLARIAYAMSHSRHID
jgi:hypothetical protein